MGPSGSVCMRKLAGLEQAGSTKVSDQELYFDITLVSFLRALHTVDEGLEVQLFWRYGTMHS